MSQSALKFPSQLAVAVLLVLGLIELGFAPWTVLEPRYRSIAYNLADVGYIDLWILRYLSLCLFAASIITLVMCVILLWGLFSTHAFIFIAATMVVIIAVGELSISILTFANKYRTRVTLIEQLPKLVITYRQGNDERAMRALDILQFTFQCCGSDGRLSFQNNVPSSCNMYSVGCLNRTLYFLDSWMDALAYILLFFSLIKLFIVLFFYSFMCVHQHSRRNQASRNAASGWPSVSGESSSEENVPRQHAQRPPSPTKRKENAPRYTERRRVHSNEYDASAASQQIPLTATMTIEPKLLDSNDLNDYYRRQHASRKLSSISERTERTETDDSEPDLLRLKHFVPNRSALPGRAQSKQLPPAPPKKLPVIKARRRPLQEDEFEHDSGVERSSSEKSFEDQMNQKLYPNSKPANNNSSSSLSFSNVFITSVSRASSEEDDLRKPLRTPSPQRALPNQPLLPKPILKKPIGHPPSIRTPADYYNQRRLPPMYIRSTPLFKNIPKPNPRSSLRSKDSLL